MVSELWSPFALISIALVIIALVSQPRRVWCLAGNYHRRGPYFDGTNFASWKNKMKMHVLGHNPPFGLLCALVCKVNSSMGENQIVKQLQKS